MTDASANTGVNEKVYIHEFIDVMGQNRARYMHHMTANWCPVARAERNQLCFGVWATVGSTGPWPEVVNLWELDGWAGLVGNFEHEFSGGGSQDPSLAQWWAAAAGLRRGGEDRIVVPASWSPTVEQLTTAGTRGEVYVHEVVETTEGPSEYLDAVAGHAIATVAEFGGALIGAFETVLPTDREAIVIWALPSWASWAEWEQAARRTGQAQQWHEIAGRLGAVTRRTLMVDAPLAPLRTGRQPQVEDRRPLDSI